MRREGGEESARGIFIGTFFTGADRCFFLWIGGKGIGKARMEGVFFKTSFGSFFRCETCELGVMGRIGMFDCEFYKL